MLTISKSSCTNSFQIFWLKIWICGFQCKNTMILDIGGLEYMIGDWSAMKENPNLSHHLIEFTPEFFQVAVVFLKIRQAKMSLQLFIVW